MRRRYIRLAAMLIALAVVLGEPIGAQEVACNVSYPCWGTGCPPFDGLYQWVTYSCCDYAVPYCWSFIVWGGACCW